MIGIIGALEIEVERLIENLEEPVRQTCSGICYVRGRLMGREAVVTRGGIGKVNAAVCAQTMAFLYKPSLIINSGVAGALDGNLLAGDVVIGTEIVQHDVDTTALGDPPGLVSTINRIYFPCDERASQAILDASKSLDIYAVRGRIASGEQFVADSGRKSEIVRLFSASACEMEAGAIAQVCYLNQIPCAVIRSISDGGDESAAMSYEEFLPLAARNSSELVMRFLRNIEKN